jgi:DnaK suppressor protein
MATPRGRKPGRGRTPRRASGPPRDRSDGGVAPGTRRASQGSAADPRRRLEAEAASVAARLRELGGEDLVEAAGPSGVNTALDEDDAVHAVQIQEMGLDTRQRLTDRMRRLGAALERAERGEYGRCVDCGGPIARARLEAVPEVETCVECQARREREGAGAGEE